MTQENIALFLIAVLGIFISLVATLFLDGVFRKHKGALVSFWIAEFALIAIMFSTTM